MPVCNPQTLIVTHRKYLRVRYGLGKPRYTQYEQLQERQRGTLVIGLPSKLVIAISVRLSRVCEFQLRPLVKFNGTIDGQKGDCSLILRQTTLAVVSGHSSSGEIWWWPETKEKDGKWGVGIFMNGIIMGGDSDVK